MDDDAVAAGTPAGPAFEALQAVRIYVPDPVRALPFYRARGLELGWRREAVTPAGRRCWVGLRFPGGGPELVVHDDVERQFTELEVRVADVERAYREWSRDPTVLWLEPPHPRGAGGGQGLVAVLRAPDGNAFTLTGPAGEERG